MTPVRVVVVVVALVVSGGRATAQSSCWLPPVSASVVDQFREPACRWCPGNRGIEYGTEVGDPVTAVATGTVVFSGDVAGTRYVVVELLDRMKITYGNLVDVSLRRGEVVVAGSVVGWAAGHVHFGVRVGERYVDPARMIGELRGVLRLVPIDGSAAPPSTKHVVECAPSVATTQTIR